MQSIGKTIVFQTVRPNLDKDKMQAIAALRLVRR